MTSKQAHQLVRKMKIADAAANKLAKQIQGLQKRIAAHHKQWTRARDRLALDMTVAEYRELMSKYDR